jgi:hypothetical protein
MTFAFSGVLPFRRFTVRNGVATRRVNFLSNGFGIFRSSGAVSEVVYDDFGATFGQCERVGATQPSAGSCDYRYTIVQSDIHDGKALSISVVTRIGLIIVGADYRKSQSPASRVLTVWSAVADPN